MEIFRIWDIMYCITGTSVISSTYVVSKILLHHIPHTLPI